MLWKTYYSGMWCSMSCKPYATFESLKLLSFGLVFKRDVDKQVFMSIIGLMLQNYF
jgi:hypothetical protein